jgi:DNA-binding NarL/FixJ family response regulator
MTGKKTGTTAVAVVEDNAELLASMRGILDATPGMRCVAALTTAEQALDVLPGIKPDVVFMDINLPGMNGVDCVRQLANRLPHTLLVMLTISSNIDAVFASLQAGACGYLHKPVHADDLVNSVREVVAGGSPMSATIARMVVQSFKSQPAPAASASGLPLTDRERTVLEYLAKGYLYKEIADLMQVSWHTVHNHIRHIYEKLHVRSRAQAVAKFRGR